MARITGNLKIRKLDTMPEGRHPDGRYGLYFNVKGASRSWVQRLTINGKRCNFGLGPYPVVTLAEARDAAFENVRKRFRGIDPRAERKRERTVPTFAEASEAVLEIQAKGWKAGSRNAGNWRSTMVHAKAIALMPVDQVATADILGMLRRLHDAGKAPTARTLRQRIRQVLDWAIASGHRPGANPANGELDALLPKTDHRVAHHATAGDVAGALAAVAAIDAPTWHGTKAAFRFLVLTAARTSEVLGARWDEIDLDAKAWTVPAARMKAKRAHRVPLSEPALDVLREAKRRTGGEGIVFLSPRRKQLDDAALRRLLRHSGAGGTVHGFRGAFKSWCMEHGIPRELAEMSLAHQFMGDVEASYVRTDLLEKRRPVMERWARHCTETDPAAKVVAIR